MERLSDTSPEAEKVLRAALREMPFARKWRQMGAVYQPARALHAAHIHQQHPDATAEDIQAAWTTATLGSELAAKIKEAQGERGGR